MQRSILGVGHRPKKVYSLLDLPRGLSRCAAQRLCLPAAATSTPRQARWCSRSSRSTSPSVVISTPDWPGPDDVRGKPVTITEDWWRDTFFDELCGRPTIYSGKKWAWYQTSMDLLAILRHVQVMWFYCPGMCSVSTSPCEER